MAIRLPRTAFRVWCAPSLARHPPSSLLLRIATDLACFELTRWSNQMVKRAVKKARERDTDTEARILDAAHVVFVRRGTAGARMQEIADEAGVNKALLHY